MTFFCTKCIITELGALFMIGLEVMSLTEFSILHFRILTRPLLLATVTCGVPQGSVLGPLLFLIYMNDIYKAVPHINVKLFADDTNVFLFDQNSKNLSLKAAECLNKLSDWFIANKLSFNLTKTCYMVFNPKKMTILN